MKRNSLFIQIFSGFLVAITLFIIVLTIFFRIGLNNAIINWEKDSLGSLKDVAVNIIQNRDNILMLNIPQDEPLFIYDTEKILIYSNRGSGKHNTQDKDYYPLFVNEQIVGYLYTVQIHFMDNNANKQFSSAINKAIIIALIFSVILVLLLALFITGKISKPAKNIIKFLEQFTDNIKGDLLDIKGAEEIQMITVAVNDLSSRLAEEREIRRQWSQDIAHDLRTPVSALKAQFEAMSQGILDINLKRVNQNMNEILRMELLVEDLSELMRLEEPEIKLYRDDIDSKDFIRQITYRHNESLKKRNITLIVENHVAFFKGDEMLLHRALSNMFNNAVRHTDNSGYIKLSIMQSSGNIIFSLENSGDVIPEQEQIKIFDRLFRGEAARESRGSGLGLTITKKIVELHQGTISVTSSVDRGTIFVVNITE